MLRARYKGAAYLFGELLPRVNTTDIDFRANHDMFAASKYARSCSRSMPLADHTLP
jgi:hypothetical protein